MYNTYKRVKKPNGQRKQRARSFIEYVSIEDRVQYKE